MGFFCKRDQLLLIPIIANIISLIWIRCNKHWGKDTILVILWSLITQRLLRKQNTFWFMLVCDCNEVSRYGKKEAGTGEHLNTFNNQINKHNRKAAAPHGRLPQTKHKLKSRPGPLSSSTVVTPHVTPHLTLPKLLRGTWDRWAVQVSFITNYSTGLAPFPRLSAPPHSPHTPIAPRRPGGTHETALYSPPPPSPGGEPVRAAAAYLGVRTDEAREKETEGWGVTETREGRKEKIKTRSGSRTHCRSVLNQLSGSLAVPCDGTGHLWWTARCSSASWRTAVAPPVEGSRQRVPRSLLLPKHGGWQQASASRRTGRLLRSLSDDSHPSSTQEHGSESSVPPVLLLLQHHRFGQPLAVSATSCCPISSAPRSPSAARALWQRVPPSSRASAPM